MNPELISLNTGQRGILRRMRPPCAKALKLTHPFQHNPANYGFTLRVISGEPVIAPGDGKIVLIRSTAASWLFTKPSIHEFASTYAVVLDHGQGVKTILHGLASVDISFGQTVRRGVRLGLAADQEVFFGIQLQNNFFDPATINRHFIVKDERLVVGQGGFIKQAPDLLIRAAGNVVSSLYKTIRYFWDKTVPPILINIDFNGSGLKVGQAAVGVASTDYWNILEPADYIVNKSGYYNCFGISSFSTDPIRFLKDYTGKNTMVQFERIAATNNFGTSLFFDPMLSTWVGGYSGSSPYTNFFAIRGLPTGSYRFLIYANNGTGLLVSNFYVALDNDSPTLKINAPTVTPAFIQDANYVNFSMVVPLRSVVNFKVYGYVAGLQIYRSHEDESAGLPKLSLPRFSPPSGSIIVQWPTMIVVLSSPESGVIRYTVDGSTPNLSSAIYTGPLEVNLPPLIKAYVTKPDFADSDVATATYTPSLTVDNFEYAGETGPSDHMGPYTQYSPNGKPDFDWLIEFNLPSIMELVRIELYQTDVNGVWNSGQVWATNSPIYPGATLPWPGHSPLEPFGCFGLGIFDTGTGLQQNFQHQPTQGNYAQGFHGLELFGDKSIPAEGYFRIFLFFGDGSIVTSMIPAF